MHKLHMIKSPINNNDPMNGLFEKSFKHLDILNKGVAIINQSSIYGSYPNASVLLYRKEGSIWASNSTAKSWFEIYFPYHFIEMIGYGLMQAKNDDEITRAWKVSCMMNNGETILHNQPDTSIFCGGKTGTICGSYDKHAFSVTKVMMCNRFRITQTGKNGRPSDHFVLSGVEFFGEIFYIKGQRCSIFRSRRVNNLLFMCFLSIS